MDFKLNPLNYYLHRFINVPLLLKWARLPRRLNILEIGCGSGEVARYLCPILRPKSYIAIDIDPKMITQAEKNSSDKSSIIFQVADVKKLPFEKNSFDVVIELNTLHHLQYWKKGLDEIHRVLRPKGKLLIKDLSIETFSVPFLGLLLQKIMDHPYDHMYDQKEFMSYLRHRGFQMTHMVDQSLMLLLVATLIKK